MAVIGSFMPVEVRNAVFGPVIRIGSIVIASFLSNGHACFGTIPFHVSERI